jgi:anti-sigma factor RsiW
MNGGFEAKASGPSFDAGTLGAYVDNELDEAAAAAVESALRESAELRERVEHIRWITGLVRRVYWNPN